MSTQNLDKIFRPQRIAVVGACDAPHRPGSTVLRNLIGEDCRRVVYPINPHSESVLGVAAYPDLLSLPRTPDLAVICAPPAATSAAVAKCGEAGIPGVIILSPGYPEATCDVRAFDELRL